MFGRNEQRTAHRPTPASGRVVLCALVPCVWVAVVVAVDVLYAEQETRTYYYRMYVRVRVLNRIYILNDLSVAATGLLNSA